MNLIVNFSNVDTDAIYKKYNLKLNGKTIIEKIISQVQLRDVNKIILLVNSQFTKQFTEVVAFFEFAPKVEIQELSTQYQKQIAKSLTFDDISSTYQLFKSLDADKFFTKKINQSVNTILIDGSKLYKKNIFNFSKTSSNTYIKFIDKEAKIKSNYILFFCNECSNQDQEAKIVIVDDYIYNFIDMRNLKTLIQSSSAFADDKQLRYEYVNQLLEELEFDQALDEVSHFAYSDRYWRMFYLELLIGYGHEQQFINFYLSNKELILNSKFTIAQKKMYKKIYDLFEKIDNDQPLVNVDIKDYFIAGTTDFSFILSLIIHAPSKELNLGYLLSGLIKLDRLSEEQGEKLLDVINTLEVSPYVRMYYTSSLVKYFISPEKINTLSHKFINLLFRELHTNEELFSRGIEQLTSNLCQHLNIKIKKQQHIDIKELCDLSNIPQRKSKVAICITGVAKFNYEKNLELMKDLFSKLDADYFVQTWDVYEEYPALSNFGADDPDWSGYYMARIKNILPKFIERQTNFEALMPNTAELLFTKRLEHQSKTQYIDILGDDLKVIKKFNYHDFIQKIKLGEGQNSSLRNKVINSFERQVISDVLDNFVLETNQAYEFVINIDINTLLKRNVNIEEFNQIKDNQVYILCDEKNQLSSAMTITRFETARHLNNIWNICQATKSFFPFTICNQNVFDMEQNLVLLNLLYHNIQWKIISGEFGDPYLNKKIIMPKMMDTVNLDLENYEGDKQPIINYFTKADQLFTGKIHNNVLYRSIESVNLISYQITEKGVAFDISISGLGLKKLSPNSFFLHGVSDMSIDSDIARPRLYKQDLKFLKHEEDEIVVRKEILENELLNGKSWNFSIIFHNYSLTHFNIEYDSKFENLIELNKYGLKYIEFDHGFRVGMYTKSFLLNDMNN